MDPFRTLVGWLTSKRVRLEKPRPGVDWAEGRLADDRRVGEWTERIGDTTETTTWRDGKRHGPSRRVRDDGTLVIERAFADDKEHGPFRSFHGNGKPHTTCTFEHGALVGPYTQCSAAGHLETTFTSRAGKRHGTYRDLSAEGVATLEGEYVDDKREGPFTRRTPEGVVIEVASYADDVLDGAWARHFDDGKKKLATTYRAGVPGPFEVWTRTGSALGPRKVGTPEDAERFVELAEALERRDDRVIVDVLRGFAPSSAAEATALCEERAYDGFALYSLRDDLGKADDPRFGLARTIALDHATLSAKHLARMRASRLLRDLSLHEVDPGAPLSELFASGAMPALRKLALTECSGDAIALGLEVLASSDVAEHLERLTLAIGEIDGDRRAVRAILRSPRFVKLTSLSIGWELGYALDALGDGPPWPALRELSLADRLDESRAAAFAAALERRAFPSLARIVLADMDQDPPLDALGARLEKSLGCVVEGS